MLKDNIYAAQLAIRIGLEHIEDEIKKLEDSCNTRQELKYLEILNNEKTIMYKALHGLYKSYTGDQEKE
jgi:hypothetical protein